MRTPISSPISPMLRCVAALGLIAGCAAGAGGKGEAARAADTGAGAASGSSAADGGEPGADTGAGADAVAPGDGAAGGEGAAGDEGAEADAGAGADEEDAPRGEDGCAALQLREASARDEDGDGAWRPGEALWVEATLVNDGDDAFYDAPGAELQAPVDDALVPEPVVAVYSLAAGEQALLRWWAVAAPARGEAREVPLQLIVVSAEGGAVAPCPGGAHLELRVTLSGG